MIDGIHLGGSNQNRSFYQLWMKQVWGATSVVVVCGAGLMSHSAGWGATHIQVEVDRSDDVIVWAEIGQDLACVVQYEAWRKELASNAIWCHSSTKSQPPCQTAAYMQGKGCTCEEECAEEGEDHTTSDAEIKEHVEEAPDDEHN